MLFLFSSWKVPKKISNRVFLGLLNFLGFLVSVRVIERSLHVLDHTRACAWQFTLAHEHTLDWLLCIAFLRSIAPLLRSSALANYYIHAHLRSITWYLRSSAPLQLAPTNQRQLSIVFFFFFFIIVIFVYLFIFQCLSFIFYLLLLIFVNNLFLFS